MKKNLLLFFLGLIPFSIFAQENTAPPQKSPLPASAEHDNISVFPATLSFNLDKGGTSSQAITIKNTTKDKYQLALEFMDWTRDTVGQHIYGPPGSSRQSCAAWVSFDKPFVELASGESANVTVTMKVPDNEAAISEMKWTMLIVKTVTEKIAPSRSAKVETIINKTLGIGVHIYQTPPNVTNKEIKMLAFSELPAKNSYRVSCRNVGGTQMFCKFSIELSSNETGKKTTLESKVVPLFPQQDRFVDFTIPEGLPQGKYTAIALIDANDDDVTIEAAQKVITVR